MWVASHPFFLMFIRKNIECTHVNVTTSRHSHTKHIAGIFTLNSVKICFVNLRIGNCVQLKITALTLSAKLSRGVLQNDR